MRAHTRARGCLCFSGCVVKGRVISHECVTHTSSAFVRACARTCAKGPRVCVRVVRKEAELLAVDECVHPQGDLAPETRSGKVCGIFFILFGTDDDALSASVRPRCLCSSTPHDTPGLVYVFDVITGIAESIIATAEENANKTPILIADSLPPDVRQNSSVMSEFKKVRMSLGLTILCLMVGTAFFWLSGEFDLLDSFWWSLATMTTIGRP